MELLERCRRRLAEADELRRGNPKQGLERALEARELAAALDRTRVGEAAWHQVQGEAWMVLGSAHRGVLDLEQAEAAFNVAIAFLDHEALADAPPTGTCADLARRAAYLRGDQGRFEEALWLVDEAIQLYSGAGDRAPLAAALVDRALLLQRAGRLHDAIRTLVDALEQPAIGSQPRIYLAAIHNMAMLLHEAASDAAETREALQWLELAVRLHAASPDQLGRFKLQGLLGLSAIRLGEVEEGLQHLLAAHAGFERLGAAREQIGILLDIAAAELGHGLTRDLRPRAGQLFPFLRHPAIPSEGAALLRRFLQAANAGTVTPDQVQTFAAGFRRALVS